MCPSNELFNSSVPSALLILIHVILEMLCGPEIHSFFFKAMLRVWKTVCTKSFVAGNT